MINPITGIFKAKKKYQSKYYADYKERLRKRQAIDAKIAKDKQLAIDAIDKDFKYPWRLYIAIKWRLWKLIG